jgi:DNA-binding transcriptional regulator GbsR (MarR family)
MLDRLGMAHKVVQVGERKDFYITETDFWGIIRGILKYREKNEFDHALRTVGDSLQIYHDMPIEANEAELAAFYQQRLQAMETFFHTLDNVFSTILALDELRLGAVERFLGVRKE